MPALGESVTEGTVTRWLKAEGDHVALDEPLLEVSTDKVDTEIPSPAAGVLQKILVAVDSVAPVGAELALIADGASAPATPTPPAASTPAPVAAAPVAPAPAPVTPTPATPAPAAPTATSGASTAVVMPALGESVTEGTVTRWLKNVGDSVAVDEPLLEVSTDKVDTEIPSPASGVLLSIDVSVDSTVAVGTKLASIGASGAAPAPAPSVAAGAVGAAVRGAAAKTSSLRIRPPTPVPFTRERSTPLSAASLRTIGVT